MSRNNDPGIIRSCGGGGRAEGEKCHARESEKEKAEPINRPHSEFGTGDAEEKREITRTRAPSAFAMQRAQHDLY